MIVVDQTLLAGERTMDAGWEVAGGSCWMLGRGRGGPLCACMAIKLHCMRYITCLTQNLTSSAFAVNC